MEMLRRLGATAQSIPAVAINVLLPPQCLGCVRMVDKPGTLCAECWERVDFLGAPLCARCGYPFEYDHGEDALCGDCIRRPPPYERARAVMRYDESCSSLGCQTLKVSAGFSRTWKRLPPVKSPQSHHGE